MKYFWKAVTWTAIILYLSLAPSDTFPEVGVVNFDKLVHTFIYFIQTFLFVSAFYKYNRQNKFNYTFYPALIGIVLGGGIELLQSISFIGRQGDWVDMIANILGVIIAMLTFKYLFNIFSKLNMTKLI